MQEEIEKVKKRRLDREKKRADQEEMLNLLQRERGIAEAVELERKEEEFHLEQAKMRAKQRIREGRSALLANRCAQVSKQGRMPTVVPYSVCSACTYRCSSNSEHQKLAVWLQFSTLSKPSCQVCRGLQQIRSLLHHFV